VNTIAIIVINNSGPGGIILKSTICLSNRKTIEIYSDESWLCSMEKNKDWYKMDLNTDDWMNAKVIGDASAQPWKHLSNAVNFFGVPQK